VYVISDNDVILDIPDDPNHGWLAVPDIMERTGASLSTVRAWLRDHELIGVRRGSHRALMVPEGFVTEDGPLKHLRGTITVLTDSGLQDDEIIDWMHAPDDTLIGGSPVASLQAGSKTEVRRRAQETAY
jgi:hypothetical protein